MGVLEKFARGVDGLNAAVGTAARWLAVLLVLVQFVVVGLRYIYGTSFIWMQEGVIYVHATLFMLSIAYVLLIDGHVRVDIYFARWSARTRAAVDLAGVVFAVLPFCGLVLWASWPYVSSSWRLGEGAMQMGGLPFTPVLKSLIPAMATLLALQGLAMAARAILVLSGSAPTHLPSKTEIEQA
ncbi:MAG: TRAP transporter small permease subunit [Tagaea sp.]|nr:TRAP transporter small permease subunit [Tagaea sp.]